MWRNETLVLNPADYSLTAAQTWDLWAKLNLSGNKQMTQKLKNERQDGEKNEKKQNQE